MGTAGHIAIVCAGLSVLQYHWTGEASRAERARLRTALNQQMSRLIRAFDEEIRENCTMLIPDVEELREKGREEAHRFHYEQWALSHDRKLFSQIAVAAPAAGQLQLYRLDGSGHSVPTEWPPGWETLRLAMSARIRRTGPPPSTAQESTLIERPVFDYSERRAGSAPEVEWMIFEVSEDDVRTATLPHLIREYLNSASEPIYDVSVTWADPHRCSSLYNAGWTPRSAPRQPTPRLEYFPPVTDDAPPASTGSTTQNRFTRWRIASGIARDRWMQLYRGPRRANLTHPWR